MRAGEALPLLDRHWRRWLLLMWLAAAVLLIVDRWNAIGWFALGDTDDNMRIMQVRGLLHGQDWFDLRQYRLNPPYGANIHWSRLVDLPIAGIILALRPFTGGRIAEQAAVAIAPLLPLAVAMFSMGLIARRLIAPLAWLPAVALVLCGPSARGMWTPLRIDHHGWQLALLSLSALALTDRKPARAGLLLGLSTALSLTIGLEMLILCAAAGAMTVLMWVRDEREAPRLAAYGASLAGGCTFGYLLFASYANRAPVCDALSPVWLSAMAGAGAVAVLLSFVRRRSPWLRLLLAAVGGGVIAVGFALAWPDCLGKPEHLSPVLERIWFSHIREARPIYLQSWPTIGTTVSLPVAGLVGYLAMIWRARHERLLPLGSGEAPACGCPAHQPFGASALVPWLALGVLAATIAALLLWQTRSGPPAQLLAVPGATALLWLGARHARSAGGSLPMAAEIVLIFLIVSGIGLQLGVDLFPAKPDKRGTQINAANGRCPTMAALRDVALQPRGYVMTFVDLGPRLITVTHHDAVAGPYHRNGDQILTVQRFFREGEANALETVRKLGIDYVLICPNMSESTIYRSEAKKGFYVQLASGKAPAWLQPVDLPPWSPLKLWRVKQASNGL